MPCQVEARELACRRSLGVYSWRGRETMLVLMLPGLDAGAPALHPWARDVGDALCTHPWATLSSPPASKRLPRQRGASASM